RLRDAGANEQAAALASRAAAHAALDDPAAVTWLLLPGAEDADEGGVRGADVGVRESPAAGVAAGLWWCWCRWLWVRCPGLCFGDFGDGGAGGLLIDDGFAGGVGGDEGLDGEVVDGAGVAAGG